MGCKILEVAPHDLQRRYLDTTLAYFFSEHDGIRDCVWVLLAPDLQENHSICLEWIRKRPSNYHIVSRITDIPDRVENSRIFWLELAPSAAIEHVAHAFDRDYHFL